jgi:hypothetical protein
MLSAVALSLVLAGGLPPLRPVGELLLDPKGKPVTLKGCNLGNWFVQEFWMFGMPGVDPDQYGFEAKLAQRFGETRKDQIMETFRESWITERDWKIIQSYGFNLVRLPMNYRQFESDDQPKTLRPNAFKWIDRAVTEAEKHGMYVILDMHGIQGGQSVYDHTGRRDQNKIWTEPANQDRAVWLWGQIAARYRNRNAVVAYDLYNEPYGGTKPQQVELFRKLYPAVRAVDPNKLIFAHGNYDDFQHYGDPKANGWKNVGFQMHYYPGLFGNGSPTQLTHAEHQQSLESVEKIQNRLNVPFLIGEFNVVFDAAGGANMMRRYYDQHAKYRWLSTMWSYKVLSADGGNKDSWGMVSNAEKTRRIDPDSTSFEEMISWAKSFATEPLSVNEPLRKALTAKNPVLPKLPAIPAAIWDAPKDESLPGWDIVDIGGAKKGGLVKENGAITIYGSGDDIWNQQDSFRFISRPAAGDFSVTVRIDSLLETNSYAKAGLMIRASYEANSPFILLSAFPSGELQLAGRSNAGATATGAESTRNWKFGDRLRLTRTGDLVTAWYESATGWQKLGSLPWGFRGNVGVAVLSHRADRLTKAVIRDLTQD